MHKTGIFHHLGTFLLFASAILLLITTITAPVVNHFAILKVDLATGGTVNFGTFGYCYVNGPSGQDVCSGRHIGYSPGFVVENIISNGGIYYTESTATGLTHVMVLHPICCAFAGLAFLLALGAGVIGALFAAAVAALTFILTLVVMATDISWGVLIKHHFNNNNTGTHAKFGSGMWTEVAAFILLFFATFVVLFTCLSARKHRHDGVGKTDTTPGGRKRGFHLFRRHNQGTATY